MESKVEMRKIFCDTLIDLAKADERICIVNSDSRQISGTRDFEQAYPDRAFNVGIAEANMVGVAAGLAVSGKRPFVHAFGPFMTRRVLDQLTISLAYSKLMAGPIRATTILPLYEESQILPLWSPLMVCSFVR